MPFPCVLAPWRCKPTNQLQFLLFLVLAQMLGAANQEQQSDLGSLPRRRGTADCELCQVSALLGQGGDGPWSVLVERLGKHHSISDLKSRCEEFWRSSGLPASLILERMHGHSVGGAARSDGGQPTSQPGTDFLTLRRLLCMETFVCNAFTVWNGTEADIWASALLAFSSRQRLHTATTVAGDEDVLGTMEQPLVMGVADVDEHWITESAHSNADEAWIGESLSGEQQASAAMTAGAREGANSSAASATSSKSSSSGSKTAEASKTADLEMKAAARGKAVSLAAGQHARSSVGPPGDPLTPICPPDYTDSYDDLVAIRIVVVVFTGRGSRLGVLLPYLRRDLRKHNGIIDKIVFALIRPDPGALVLVKKMQSAYGNIVEVRDYRVDTWGGREGGDLATTYGRMAALYTALNESSTVYVKVDDDIVYLARHAIAELVREKLRQRCLFVSANVVNHAILSAVHQERGAHRGFEPSREFDEDPTMRLPWVRTSDVNLDPSYTFERHPMSTCILRRWDCAAIAHESFLDRLHEGTLCAFDFGWLDFNRAGYREHQYLHLSPWIGQTWEASGARWSINFFAFEAEDMQGMDWSRVYGPGDDEEEFGGGHSERRNQHSCAIGRSLAVHFSYNTQEERLLKFTDLLERYEMLTKGRGLAEFVFE